MFSYSLPDVSRANYSIVIMDRSPVIVIRSFGYLDWNARFLCNGGEEIGYETN